MDDIGDGGEGEGDEERIACAAKGAEGRSVIGTITDEGLHNANLLSENVRVVGPIIYYSSIFYVGSQGILEDVGRV